MLDNRPCILIAVLNQGEVRVELAEYLFRVVTSAQIPIEILYANLKPISYNRNQIVKKFLAAEQFDYLVMIDNDIVPDKNILDWIVCDKDIIGGLCYGFSVKNSISGIVPFILKRNKKKAEGQKFLTYSVIRKDKWDGLTECDAVGTGLIMISRKVLEHPFWKTHGGWFPNIYDKEGEKKLGLDINFCYRAKKLGFKVFSDTNCSCQHWTPMDLKFLFECFQKDADEITKLIDELNKYKKKCENKQYSESN